MSVKSDDILEQALALAEPERAALASSIFESLEPADPKADEAWAAEIKSRVDELRTGKVKTVAWSQVRAELEAKLASIG
jgi:putative addiction module component (TIGR02574 family)